MKKLIEKIEKKIKIVVGIKKIVYKILKIKYKVTNILNYILNHNIKFKSFIAIILYLISNKNKKSK